MNNFRFSNSGEVYEYSKESDAYFFCGTLNGRTESKFISDYNSYDDDED